MAGDTGLREAAKQGHLKTLLRLLHAGWSPCSVDEDGYNALHFAVWNSHVEIVKALCGADTGKIIRGVNMSCVRQSTQGGLTALHIAAMGCKQLEDIIEVLVRSGGDLQARDNLQRTPQELARVCGQPEAVRLLQDAAKAVASIDAHETAAAVTDYKAALRSQYFDILSNRGRETSPRAMHPGYQATEQTVGHIADIPLRHASCFQDPPLPKGLLIDEYRLAPAFEMVLQKPRNITTLKALSFIWEQSAINLDRRSRLSMLARTAEERLRAENSAALDERRP